MTVDAFDKCLAFTLLKEGGCVDDPLDPGGATNMGITLAVYREWMDDDTLQAADLFACSQSDLAPIYAANYWNHLRCDTIPVGVDLMVFDAAVNQGPSWSARSLQQLVGLRGKDVDGWIGAQTIGLLHKAEPKPLIHAFFNARMARYRSLHGWDHDSAGWTNRALDCLNAGLRMQATSGTTALS